MVSVLQTQSMVLPDRLFEYRADKNCGQLGENVPSAGFYVLHGVVNGMSGGLEQKLHLQGQQKRPVRPSGVKRSCVRSQPWQSPGYFTG